MDIKYEIKKLINNGQTVGKAIVMVAKASGMTSKDVSAIYRAKTTVDYKALPKPSNGLLWDWV